LLMYTTPVVYPLSSVKNDVLATLLKLNPMTGIIETFRYSVLGTGVFSWEMLLYTFTVTIVLFFAGITLFNKVEKNFMDSI
jgi:lipopolysaccharide transport system permease protein